MHYVGQYLARETKNFLSFLTTALATIASYLRIRKFSVKKFSARIYPQKGAASTTGTNKFTQRRCMENYIHELNKIRKKKEKKICLPLFKRRETHISQTNLRGKNCRIIQ